MDLSSRLFAVVMVNIVAQKALNVRSPRGNVLERTVWAWIGLRSCQLWEPGMLSVPTDNLSARMDRLAVSWLLVNMAAVLFQRYYRPVNQEIIDSVVSSKNQFCIHQGCFQLPFFFAQLDFQKILLQLKFCFNKRHPDRLLIFN